MFLKILLTCALLGHCALALNEVPSSAGTACVSNSNCPARNSYCNIVSPSCGMGTCECFPGFVRASDYTCRKGQSRSWQKVKGGGHRNIKANPPLICFFQLFHFMLIATLEMFVLRKTLIATQLKAGAPVKKLSVVI